MFIAMPPFFKFIQKRLSKRGNYLHPPLEIYWRRKSNRQYKQKIERGENMAEKTKGINLEMEEQELKEMAANIKELPMQDKATVKGVILGLKMARDNRPAS